jgi:hypothetical protein
MVRKLWLYPVLILLAGSTTLGCNRNAVQQKPPPDPLLTSVKVTNKTVSEHKTPSSGRDPSGAYPAPPSLPENPVTVAPASRLVPLEPYRE